LILFSLFRASISFCQAASLPSLLKITKPSVTTIHVYDQFSEVVNQGSGFFIKPNLLVSSRHLFWSQTISNASYAKAITNGGDKSNFLIRYVLAEEPDCDLVLMQTEVQNSNTLLPLGLNVSMAELEEGEPIYVISSPLGIPGITSSGIVSAIHNEYEIQITAPISKGSSGAPILNYNGQVVGVVMGHFSQGQHINFGASIGALTKLFNNIQQRPPEFRVLDPFEIRPVIPTSEDSRFISLPDWIREQNRKHSKLLTIQI